MEEWAAVAPNEPSAVILATAGADGRPSARTVLLRGFDATRVHGVHELREPQGPGPGRQPARRAAVQLGAAAAPGAPARADRRASPREESEAYFATRPRGQPAGRVGVAPVERARRPGRARGALRGGRARASRARTSRARRTGAATAWCPTRSSCGRAAPTGCTTASATSATPRAARRLEDRPPQPVEPALATAGDEAGDEVLLVGHRLGVGEVAPHRHGARAGAGRQLELHAAVTRAGSPGWRGGRRAARSGSARGRRSPRSLGHRGAQVGTDVGGERAVLPAEEQGGQPSLAAVAVDRDRRRRRGRGTRPAPASRPGRSRPTGGASAGPTGWRTA